ncbi:alpha/beta fold hydrolase [Streptosporangium vulgare]|uniref:Alpha/beta fold hydrolase n=1 Tax=Streptosporangium vulgare TaxID=46190 RepID=A0ABV5T9F0_9ACTN
MTRFAGAVVVLHGGRARGHEPTTPTQLAVLRMIPFERAVRRAVRGRDVVVSRPRFRVRGWNGAEASPVADLHELVEGLGVPAVLIGHSMGARAALRMVGHPLVVAVAALAPWLPAGEPAGHLGGTRVLLAHGDRDTVTDPRATWAYAERLRRGSVRAHGSGTFGAGGSASREPGPGAGTPASRGLASGAGAPTSGGLVPGAGAPASQRGAAGEVAAIEVAGEGHAMLRRAALWHRLAAEFTLLSLDGPTGAGPVTDAFRGAAAGLSRQTV